MHTGHEIDDPPIAATIAFVALFVFVMAAVGLVVFALACCLGCVVLPVFLVYVVGLGVWAVVRGETP